MTIDPLNKLCKWRSVFAGWIFGTRAMNAPGTRGMRDLAEKWLIMRAENNAIVDVLVTKGICTNGEFRARMLKEAAWLDRDMEKQFPGMRTRVDGVELYDPILAQKTMQDLGFPP